MIFLVFGICFYKWVFVTISSFFCMFYLFICLSEFLFFWFPYLSITSLLWTVCVAIFLIKTNRTFGQTEYFFWVKDSVAWYIPAVLHKLIFFTSKMSLPNLCSNFIYKLGQYFLDRQYVPIFVDVTFFIALKLSNKHIRH